MGRGVIELIERLIHWAMLRRHGYCPACTAAWRKTAREQWNKPTPAVRRDPEMRNCVYKGRSA